MENNAHQTHYYYQSDLIERCNGPIDTVVSTSPGSISRDRLASRAFLLNLLSFEVFPTSAALPRAELLY
jgi:hypothetical protein